MSAASDLFAAAVIAAGGTGDIFHFEEASGNFAGVDVNRSGTPVATPSAACLYNQTSKCTPCGTGAGFTRASSHRLALSGSNDWRGTNTKTTAMFVVYTTDVVNRQAVVTQGSDSGSGGIDLHIADPIGSLLCVEVGVHSSSPGQSFRTDRLIASGIYYHIAVVFDNADTTKDAVYINGAPQAIVQTNRANNGYSDTNANAFLGNDGGAKTTGLNGTIDELMWATGYLASAADVAAVFNALCTEDTSSDAWGWTG